MKAREKPLLGQCSEMVDMCVTAVDNTLTQVELASIIRAGIHSPGWALGWGTGGGQGTGAGRTLGSSDPCST